MQSKRTGEAVKVRGCVLVTGDMIEKKVTEDIWCSAKCAQNIGIIGKLLFGNQIADGGDIADSTGAGNEEFECALDTD